MELLIVGHISGQLFNLLRGHITKFTSIKKLEHQVGKG